MARGWESKSVEEQQSELTNELSSRRIPMTKEEVEICRRREGLALSRKNVLAQLNFVTNSAHRAMLERALSDLDHQIAQLDDSH